MKRLTIENWKPNETTLRFHAKGRGIPLSQKQLLPGRIGNKKFTKATEKPARQYTQRRQFTEETDTGACDSKRQQTFRLQPATGKSEVADKPASAVTSFFAANPFFRKNVDVLFGHPC